MKSARTNYSYIYGPIHSRRYGLSLGVDPIPFKTCTLNCRFCQLPPTAHPTLTRISTPDAALIIDELRAWIKADGKTDYITLCGSGEPTLNLGFGRILQFVREETPYKSLLLTNGTLFTDADVRKDAAWAHTVKLSLHAWDQASFEAVTRPHPDLSFEKIIEGYRAFRADYAGLIDLEVFIIPGCNDTPEQVERIAAVAKTIRPDTVTLNTAVRTPADTDVKPASPLQLDALRSHFSWVEERQLQLEIPQLVYTPEALRAYAARHPLPPAELARVFNCTVDEVRSALGESN